MEVPRRFLSGPRKTPIDPVLKPGGVTTAVDVSDVTPLIAVDNAVVATTMEHARIEQLPINGRQLNTFQTLMPGAEGSGGTNGFRLFGQPAQAEEWIVDGAVVTDRRWNMSLYSQAPGVGAVEEFTVLADAVTAKYTRPVNVVVSTKSGTDRLHGTAYETIRNSAIGVARRRQDTFTKAPHLVRNEFGFNAGGPVIIPRLYNGRNKTFFFGYTKPASCANLHVTYNLPTPAMRNGDFSGLLDSQNRLQVLYDPLSTGPAPTTSAFPSTEMSFRSIVKARRRSIFTASRRCPTTASIPCSTSTGMASPFNSIVTRRWSAASTIDSPIATCCTRA